MPGIQSRLWVGTLNNCRIELSQLMSQWHADGKIVYGVGQTEVGQSGTTHHQLYVVTDKKRTNKWCQDNLFKGYWAKREGSHDQARDYCMKIDSRIDGSTSEIGHYDPSVEGQGNIAAKKASTLLDVKRDIDAGMHSDQLWQAHFGHMLRYNKGFNAYRISKRETYRTEHTRSLVLYGPTGTGKSHLALDISVKLYGNAEVYWFRPQFGKEWFDGYTGQKVCIFDEFYGQMPISTLLRFLDRYPLNVETKGSFIPFTSELIIFTSNKNPEDWYRGAPGADPTTSTSGIPPHVLNALDRRLKGKYGCIKHLTEVYVPVDDGEITFEDQLEIMLMESRDRKASASISLIEEGPPPILDLTADEELPLSDQDTEEGFTSTPVDDEDFEEFARSKGYVTARSLLDEEATDDEPALGPPTKRSRQAALAFAAPAQRPGWFVWCNCLDNDDSDIRRHFQKKWCTAISNRLPELEV